MGFVIPTEGLWGSCTSSECNVRECLKDEVGPHTNISTPESEILTLSHRV